VTSPDLDRQTPLPVEESQTSEELDFRSLYLGEEKGRSSTACQQPVSGLPAMDPIVVVGIRDELEALPGYHPKVRNRLSSVRRDVNASVKIKPQDTLFLCVFLVDLIIVK